MRKKMRLVAAGSALLALAASSAGPAGAQEVVLGALTIDPTEGQPGDVVSGTVEQDLIAEGCASSAEEFAAPIDLEYLNMLGDLESQYNDAHWPEGPPPIEEDAERFALIMAGSALVGIGFVEGNDQVAWEQSHVLTFADIETQQPVGELSSFDPATGQGEVTVPDLEPGQAAVAATCLQVNTEPTLADLEAAVAAGQEFVEQNLTAPYPTGISNPDFVAAVSAAAPAMLGQTFLVPGDQWVGLFCVQGGGFCESEQTPPTTDDPGGPDDPDDPDDPSGPGGPDDDPDGPSGGGPDDDPDGPSMPVAPPAQPVPGEPTFVG